MMERRGMLHSWDDDKGFGFIQPDDGGARLFVHISAMRGDARPLEGAPVLFVAGSDDKGRPRATHMRGEALSIDRPAIRRKPREKTRLERGSATDKKAAGKRGEKTPRTAKVRRPGLKLVVWALLCSLPLAGAITLFSQRGQVVPLALYLAVSLLSFLLYRGDKLSAQQSGQRTPENMLHLSELLGGWPGALIAQQVFRHKTRKLSYQAVFWLIVAAHQLFWVDWLLLGGRYTGPLLGGWF